MLNMLHLRFYVTFRLFASRLPALTIAAKAATKRKQTCYVQWCRTSLFLFSLYFYVK
jgi:hypothetical protein